MQKNRFEVAGFAAARPAARFLPSGTKVANVRLGETYRYSGPDNQVHSQTNWHSLTFYGELADVAIEYEQGDNLFVEGVLQQRKFTPKDGVSRTIYEVVVKSCHRIAPSRRAAAASGDKVPVPVSDEKVEIDAEWPVGPA